MREAVEKLEGVEARVACLVVRMRGLLEKVVDSYFHQPLDSLRAARWEQTGRRNVR